MKISKQDLEMADDVYGAILTQTPTVHRLTIWSLAALFSCFIVNNSVLLNIFNVKELIIVML